MSLQYYSVPKNRHAMYYRQRLLIISREIDKANLNANHGRPTQESMEKFECSEGDRDLFCMLHVVCDNRKDYFMLSMLFSSSKFFPNLIAVKAVVK